MRPLSELTIVEARAGLLAKEFSVRELWDACHAAAHAKNPQLNAYLEIFAADEAALAAAQEAIDTLGEKSPVLTGIPVAVKDNILIKGHVASAASKMLEHHVAMYDSTAARRLREAGALFLGRTNMDEFAMGGSTENSAYGPTKNPHDLTRVPGGTSGGSAAALAAHTTIAAVGSDTGGSVRQPASFCGVVGMKPTYGTVSRYGLIAMGSSLDQVGPFGKTVEDAEILYSVLKGKDPLDATSREPGVPVPGAAVRKVGVPTAFVAQADPEVRAVFDAAVARLSAQGVEVVPIELPRTAKGIAIYYIVMFAEASTNLSRFDGVRYGLHKDGANILGDYLESRTAGFGPEVRRRILLGTYVLSSGYIDAYYRTAEKARTLLRKEYAKTLSEVDAILTPTAPGVPWKFGEKEDPVAMYLADIFSVIANLTGNPAMSVPAGAVEKDGATLPVGIQATTAHGREDLLFALGKALAQ